MYNTSDNKKRATTIGKKNFLMAIIKNKQSRSEIYLLTSLSLVIIITLEYQQRL